ncbi:MAG: cytotoxic translational repressor of toxin-antitoxin stability system [Candidatus Peregrinibacteria bacterium GW2011_GWF2_43_17]|nr:MAG: cytotoxic translational repressor of toxin-antitoxin stability system [Candidatus Peregrinibacteria bacterium GW2011_GWF2_43_17]
MNFRIKYHDAVCRFDVPKLPKSIGKRIKFAIEEKLMTEPAKFGKPLRRSLKGYRKLRVGDYRIVFRIEGDSVLIFAIEHRSRVYLKITKRSSLDHSIASMDRLLDKIDTSKLPSAKEQFKDI